MAGVSFNKTYLSRLVGKSIDFDKIAQQATKMGVEFEGADSTEMRFQITANRPDLLDIVGFARALKNFMHKSKKFSYKMKSSAPYLEINVGKDVSGIRPFISGIVAKNIDFDDQSLKHLLNFSEKFSDIFGRHREKLAIGMHNLDKIGTVLKYDAFPDQEFVALGEKKSMLFSKVLETNKKGIEYGDIITCHKTQNCYPALKDLDGVLALIPVVNSERTKISTSTHNMFIDMTGTSKYVVDKAADMFAATLMDMGADIYPVKVNYGKKSNVFPIMEERSISIPLGQIDEVLGVSVGFNNALSLAEKMGYACSYLNKKIVFKIPSYRLDILTDQDIIEDMAIAYGYEYIANMPIYSTQTGMLEERTEKNRKLSAIMTGLGFGEMMNSYLTSENENFNKMRVAANQSKYIKLKNSKTGSITMMRTWILPSLLKNFSLSVHEKMPQKIFEADVVFALANKMPSEKYHLSAAMADPKANFNDIKSVLESVLNEIPGEYTFRAAAHESFIEGRVADIVVGKATVGFVGELHPEVLSNFGIEEPCFGFEIII